MPRTVNERLADAAIDHAIDLAHYSNDVVRRMIATLNRADAELAAALQDALDRLPVESFTVQRLDALLRSVRRINAQAYDRFGLELERELRDFAAAEIEFQIALAQSALPPQVLARVSLTGLTPEAVYAAATAQPLQGRLMREWAVETLSPNRMRRITDALRMGYVEQQTIPQIMQRIRGTKAANYLDGILRVDRRQAEAIARTGVMHIAATAREEYYAQNEDLIKALRWVATLDTRTSVHCRLRDGHEYTSEEPHRPIGHKLPWGAGPGRFHWNCRSTSAPVFKSWRELGVDMKEFPEGTRASMDGQVPGKTTYAQWLGKQSAARQDEVLGKTRGALFRRGGLRLEQFATEQGRWLTLAELRGRNVAAFERAGVD